MNVAPWLWGWPDRVGGRMAERNAALVVIGPWARGQGHVSGVDTAELQAQVPDAFDGWVWTNRVETIRREP